MNGFFTSELMRWAPIGTRDLPWKTHPNPYRIWLAEIILQQTRVEQGIPYYQRFIEKFPDVYSLARATEDEVLKCWQGLGYYSRARNLHKTAKTICKDYGGCFPHTYQQLLKLAGIGPYTAAAIASFAFGLPHAVVDGNVQRVLARFFGVFEAVDTSRGRRQIEAIATSQLSHNDPAVYNQAIMDFGAGICKPSSPLCEECTLSSQCVAFSEGKTKELPLKKAKVKRKERFFSYLIMESSGNTWVHRRSKKDIWKGLYEFPMMEQTGKTPWRDVTDNLSAIGLPSFEFTTVHLGDWMRQDLTHQRIHARFARLQIHKTTDSITVQPPDCIPVAMEFIHTFAFPRIIDRYLAKTL